MHRALMVCTKHRLNGEIERIKKILLNNGYPKNVNNVQIVKKFAQCSTLKQFGPEKCPVYLRVPWIGKLSTNLKKKSKPPWKAAVVPSAPAWSLHQSTCCLWPVLPTTQKSSVMYEYKCHCDSRYVRRTCQRLQDRINQHVLQWLRQQLTRPLQSQSYRLYKQNDTKPDCDSAICQHLLENDHNNNIFQTSPHKAALFILIS